MSAGMDRRGFLKSTVAGVGASMAIGQASSVAVPAAKGKNVAGLTVSPIETVRIGMIGVGARGGGHLNTYLRLAGCEIRAICDIHEPAALSARNRCVKKYEPKPDAEGKPTPPPKNVPPPPELYTKGEHDYRRMLERDDLDLVVIATPWRWHTPQAVDAMKAGKHCAIEVPAAVTTEECWQLVDTAEATQKHCMMLENCCYGRDELMLLHMCRLGAFGDLLHGECAYIHDLRGQMNQLTRGTGFWRTGHHEKRNGNLYPTHGLGPVAQYMNINRGDKFDYMVSMSSPALGRAAYARKRWPADHERNKASYICGDMNTSLIKTAKGRTIMLQHDTTTPRPYDRINQIQGTKGCFRGYPSRVHVDGRGGGHGWQDMAMCYTDFEHPLWKRMGEESKKAGGHGGMDFLMNWRLIYCLRNGEPLDQDVYDGASWSVVGPISEVSVANRSAPVDVPDFTRGAWKTMKPLPVIT